MFQEEVDIKKLQDRVAKIRVQARDERRGLNHEESVWIVEAESEIEHLRASLPGEPLTRPGPRGGASYDTTGSRPFASFGEQLAAVMRAGIPGQPTDPRLHQIRAAATGLNETVPSEGGFLVQSDFTTALLAGIYKTGILASRCRRIQISTNANGIKIPCIDESSRASTRWGGIVSYWSGEAGEITASKPAFRQLELSLKKLTGLCYATDELIGDSSVLEAVVKDGFIQEFGFRLDDAIVRGTGAGQPLGVLNAGSLVSVAKESGQAPATFVTENAVKMYSRLLPGSEATAAWFVNKDVLPQLYTMSISVGTGGAPIFMPAGGISGQPYNSLLGLPVVPIEQASTLGTVGDVILADLANGYVLAEKGPTEVATSIHVRFAYDESVFRFVLRVDGQPFLASALTPYKGSNSLSHFVVTTTR